MRILSPLFVFACLVLCGAAGVAVEEPEPQIELTLYASPNDVTLAQRVFLALEIRNESGEPLYLYAGQEKDFAGQGRIRITYPDEREIVVPFPDPEPVDDPSLAWVALEDGASVFVPLRHLNTHGNLFDQEGAYTLTAEVELHIRDAIPSAKPEAAGLPFVSTPFPLFRPKLEEEPPLFVPFDLLERQSGMSVRNIRMHRNTKPPKEWKSISPGDARGIFVDDSHWYEVTLISGKRHLLVRDGTKKDAPVLFEGAVNTEEEQRRVPEGIRSVLTARRYGWKRIQVLMTNGTYMYTESVREDGEIQFIPNNHSGVHFNFHRIVEVLF